MNKHFFCAAFTLSIIALSNVVHADHNNSTQFDTWSGFYVGPQAGYLENNSDIKIPLVPITLDADASGPAVGAIAGYDKQYGRWVFGIEGDISAVDVSHNASIGAADDRGKLNTVAHLRARAGITWKRVLVFVAGGLALADYEGTAGFGGAKVVRDKTIDGYSIGAGIEYALSDQIRVRGEYIFDDYGTEKIRGAVGVFDRFHEVETHTVRAAVVWMF